MSRVLVAFVLLVLAPVARADDARAATESPERVAHRVTHNALLLHPAAFASRGVTLGYERALPDARFSVIGRFAFAAPVRGDFRSRGWGFGLEGRFYVLGRGPFTRYEAPAPVGPFLGLRTHLTVTSLFERATDRRVGRSERLALELSAGCRFTIGGAVEIAPFVGFVVYSDFVSNARPTLLPSFALGATIGGLFERRRQPPAASPGDPQRPPGPPHGT